MFLPPFGRLSTGESDWLEIAEAESVRSVGSSRGTNELADVGAGGKPDEGGASIRRDESITTARLTTSVTTEDEIAAINRFRVSKVDVSADKNILHQLLTGFMVKQQEGSGSSGASAWRQSRDPNLPPHSISQVLQGEQSPPTPPVEDEEEEEFKRDHWSHHVEFFLSLLGFAVGFGNIWRYPFLVYRHGGGTFVMLYLAMLLLVGIPIFFMELAFGQFGSNSPVLTIGAAVPLFEGLGWAMMVISTLIPLYYNVVLAWAIYFLWASFTDVLPWTSCRQPWNDPLTCYDTYEERECKNSSSSGNSGNHSTTSSNDETGIGDSVGEPTSDTIFPVYFGGYCLHSESDVTNLPQLTYNATEPNFSWTWCTAFCNKTGNLTPESIEIPQLCDNCSEDVATSTTYAEYAPNFAELQRLLAASRREAISRQYFERYVLDISPGIGAAPSRLKGHLVLSLLVAWLVVYLSMVKGIKTSGKVVYFSATFPYVVILIILIRGVTLPGAHDGIMHYIRPQAHRLRDIQVWVDAAAQTVYSLGIGTGGVMTLSSYNRFKNNCLRDAVTVGFLNAATSIFAGFAVFAFIGFIAHETKVPIESVAGQRETLLFITYPQAFLRLSETPVIWSMLFFLMIILLGLDSQFAMVENVLTAITDRFQHVRPWKELVALALCMGMFFLGLTMATTDGIYWLQLIDTFSIDYCIASICLMELVVIVYFYGCERFLEDINMMIGQTSCYTNTTLAKIFNSYWRFTWYLASPCITLVVFAHLFFGRRKELNFPTWFLLLGVLMVVACILPVPVMAVYRTITYKRKNKDKSCREILRFLMTSSPEWGPALNVFRTGGRYQPLERENEESIFAQKQRDKAKWLPPSTHDTYQDTITKQQQNTFPKRSKATTNSKPKVPFELPIYRNDDGAPPRPRQRAATGLTPQLLIPPSILKKIQSGAADSTYKTI